MISIKILFLTVVNLEQKLVNILGMFSLLLFIERKQLIILIFLLLKTQLYII